MIAEPTATITARGAMHGNGSNRADDTAKRV
jgi:hypothetical protein